MLNLLDKLKKDQIMAPYVWDNMSCASAKTGGAEVAVVSEASVSRWAVGYPDCGLLTADDMVRATDYIKGNIDICLCVEARDCYGETPVHAYRTCERLIKAGADAVIIDDSTDWRGNCKSPPGT